VLDTVIKLVHPLNYRAAEGARFEVHLEKARQVWGEQIEPFEARLLADDKGWRWERHSLYQARTAADRKRDILLLQRQGLGMTDIADKLGINRSTVFRHLQSEAEGEDTSPRLNI